MDVPDDTSRLDDTTMMSRCVIGRHHVTHDINQALAEGQNFGARLADRVARFGGSWTFIVIFVGIFFAWVVINTTSLPRYFEVFDSYPYIFLNPPADQPAPDN